MRAYILLFRGVGGKTQLPTKPLREALTAAGYANVGTYINSGNAYLKTDVPRSELLQTVKALCATHFGFEKDIYALTVNEWRKLIANNPFPDAAANTPQFVHAAVLAEKPLGQNIDLVRSYAVKGEHFEVVGKVAYLHTPHGLSASKLGARFDKAIGVPNTARNWNSVTKLMALVEDAART